MGRPVGLLTGTHQGWAQRDSRVASAGTRGTVFHRAGKKRAGKKGMKAHRGDPGRGARRNWRQRDTPCFVRRSVLGSETQGKVQPLGRRVSHSSDPPPVMCPLPTPEHNVTHAGQTECRMVPATQKKTNIVMITPIDQVLTVFLTWF